ncbi:MAG: DUF1559 domain-containing protein [Planctomycetota bacterium]|nr:DUF1559 domain-containing protein [Planctomycetota bacterium]
MSENPYASSEVPNSLELPPRRWGSLFLKVFLLTLVVVVIVALLGPLNRGRGTRESARRTQCKNNLKQIGLALHNYHDKYGSFPPAFTMDSNGRMLHSWRTLLLPYLDQSELYKQVDLSKPWNDPANAGVLETSLAVFQCPSARTPSNHTLYLCVCGPDFCFYESTPKAISDITDGTSNTLIVVEVPQDRSVPWMAPQDADEGLILGIVQGSRGAHPGFFHAALADGSVRFLSVDIDRPTLRAILTISGDETVGEF